jgi:hypothetical protein
VVFGRVDARSGVLYVGRQLISGDGDDPLVVSWHAPAAAAYFEATHADAKGVERKRVFECDGNTIVNFTDVVFADVAEAVDRHLLAELTRAERVACATSSRRCRPPSTHSSALRPIGCW